MKALIKCGQFIAVFPDEMAAERGLQEDETWVDVTDWPPEQINEFPWSKLPVLPAQLALFRTMAITRVNLAAGECRSRYMTSIPGQESTYLMKEQEARAYSNDPLGTYPILQAEALACDQSVAEIVHLVLTTATAWRTIAARVEGLRRGAIVAIGRATTLAEVNDAANVTWP